MIFKNLFFLIQISSRTELAADPKEFVPKVFEHRTFPLNKSIPHKNLVVDKSLGQPYNYIYNNIIS